MHSAWNRSSRSAPSCWRSMEKEGQPKMMPLKRSDCTSDMRTTASLAPTAMVPSALGSWAGFLVPRSPPRLPAASPAAASASAASGGPTG